MRTRVQIFRRRSSKSKIQSKVKEVQTWTIYTQIQPAESVIYKVMEDKRRDKSAISNTSLFICGIHGRIEGRQRRHRTPSAAHNKESLT